MLDLEEYDEPSKLEEIAFKQLDFAQKETDLGSKNKTNNTNNSRIETEV